MMPELSSMPGKDTSMPRSPADSPLRNDPSESDEIRISAIMMMAKFFERAERDGGAGDRRRHQHQRQPGQPTTNHRGGVAEPESAARIAPLGQLVAVEAGHDRVRLAGNVVSVAVISPPETPPTNMAISSVIASTLVMW